MKKKTKVILWSVLICLTLSAAGWFGWTWYDNNVDRSGWREKNGVTMYADFHGKPVTGWLDIDGSRYYFAEDHALQTGWLTQNGGTYYLGTDGRMHKRWLEMEEGRRYFESDGRMVFGWQEIDGNDYHFNEQGLMDTGWLQDGGNTFYLEETGTPVYGWQEIEEDSYYFTESGTLHSGWLETEEGTYYLAEDGPMVTGWQEIDENRYYFGDSGRMHTGWLEQGEYRYYLHSDGTAATGPADIDGETFYFSPKGIWVLLVNPWHPLDADYETDLVEIEDGWLVDRQAYEPLKAMLEAMRSQDLYPYFSSTYRNEGDQRRIWDQYVSRYLDAGYDEAQANALTASYVAVPGTSEHHTGLAMDIVGHEYYYSGKPGSSKAVQDWLAEHCWEYGFILRYTPEKQSITGYAPEAWHFRYVGAEVSMDMKDSGLCLEEYLGADKNR